MNLRIYIPIILLVSSFSALNAQEKKKSAAMVKSFNYELLLDSAEFYKSVDANKSFGYVEGSLNQILRSGDTDAEMRAYAILGEVNINAKQYDLAISNFKRVLQLSIKYGHSEYSYSSEKLICIAYEYSQDLTNAFDYSNRFYQKLKNPDRKDFIPENAQDDLVFITKLIARLNSKKGDRANEEMYYLEALEIEKQRNNSSGIIEIQNLLAELNLEQNNPESALVYYGDAEEVANESSDKMALSNTLRNKSKVFRQQNKSAEELFVRQQAFNVSKELQDTVGQVDDLLEMARIYQEQDKQEAAIPVLQQSIQMSGKPAYMERKKEALYGLSKAYEKSNVNQALNTYKEYLTLNDSINSIKEQNLLGRLELANSLNQKQQRIGLLEKNKELSDITIELLQQEKDIQIQENKTKGIVIYFLIALMLIISVSSFFVFRSARQKRIANQLLALKSLRSQMNPHFIFNALNSVNNYIAKKDVLSANRYLSDFALLMRSVLENSKHDFISLSEEIKIIELYLKLEHERFKEKFEYKFQVDPSISTDLQIPPMLVQPYIENAVWHGLRYKETKGFLEVELKEQDGGLVILIKDDGIGRKKSQEIKTDNQKKTNSTGIKNITNRIKIINEIHHTGIRINISDLQADSDCGTRVEINIPVIQEDEND